MNKMNIPQYLTREGEVFPLHSEGKERYQLLVQKTTVEEWNEYGNLLKAHGFQLYQTNEIVAEEGKHLFHTYVREMQYVFCAWNPIMETARIMITPPGALPEKEDKNTCDEGECVCSLSQMQLDGAGMQYVVQVSDGKFIIIDGGVRNEEDIRRLYEFLNMRVKKDKHPIVAMWMFTHSDPDHIQLATEFMERYADEIKIETFAYNFPDVSNLQTIQDDEAMKVLVERLEKNIATYYPNASIYVLHTGQIYSMPGVKIEILHTSDELHPRKARTYNNLSAAWRMHFGNGKTVLFLGDCMQEECAQIVKSYGKYLKSDMLQLAHHGLIGGDLRLYQLVDPAVCFWATDKERFDGTYERYKYKYCMGEGGCDYNGWLRDESVQIREHYHNGSTTTILFK